MIALAILALVLGMPGMFDYESKESRVWRVSADHMEDRHRDTMRLAREARAAGDQKAEAMWLGRAGDFAEKRERYLKSMRQMHGNYVRDLLRKLDFFSPRKTA